MGKRPHMLSLAERRNLELQQILSSAKPVASDWGLWVEKPIVDWYNNATFSIYKVPSNKRASRWKRPNSEIVGQIRCRRGTSQIVLRTTEDCGHLDGMNQIALRLSEVFTKKNRRTRI